MKALYHLSLSTKYCTNFTSMQFLLACNFEPPGWRMGAEKQDRVFASHNEFAKEFTIFLYGVRLYP